MRYLPLILSSLGRKKVRTLFTLLSVLVAFLLYGYLAAISMAFRMGVNLGDVIAGDGTIHGDGVNVAARLEKLAAPGTVCIGQSILDQVKGKLPYSYDDMGAQRLHNIADPVRAFLSTLFRRPPGEIPALPAEASALEPFHRDLISRHLERDLKSHRVLRDSAAGARG